MERQPARMPWIFIVEDEFVIREALTEFLEEEGYQVAGASNGREAIDYLRQNTSPPAVILLDLMMPIMNGQEFLQERQHDPQLASIPVILLSAASDAADRVATETVAGFLDKPVRLARMLEVIEPYCEGNV